MLISPLNLISTPVAVLNTLGLNLRVGLSSEDPIVGRHPSESYEVYRSIYSPEGLFLERQHLGQIPPNRRRFFPVSDITRESVPSLDHLTVIHRVPTRLLDGGAGVEDEIEFSDEPDYSLVRSLVEYSYPGGGNGSVIYETPPRLNAAGYRSSNTLTFTCQTVLSEAVNTFILLIHYSVSPSHSQMATFQYGLHSLSGQEVFSDRVSIGPFSAKIIDLGQVVPSHIVEENRDPQDGLSAFTLVGISEDAALLSLFINASPSLGAVALEHTHPLQSYLFPMDTEYRRKVKSEAQEKWRLNFSKTPGGAR